jgi:imidazolonepropionase-like amidohydrolase
MCKFTKSLLIASLLLGGAPALADTLAITHAKILTQGPAGDLTNGTIIAKDGVIIAIGRDLAVPNGARTIDATGKIVTPGIMLPSTNLSISEVNGVSTSREDRGGDRVGASFDVSYGVNPRSLHIPRARRAGVTSAIVMPAAGFAREGMNDEEDMASDYTAGKDETLSGLFTGRPASIRLTAADTDIITHTKLGVVFECGDAGASAAGGSRGAAMSFLREALEDARHFAANRANYDRGQSRPYALPRAELEALLPVAIGSAPLIARVHRAADITAIIKYATEHKLKLILLGAEEGWLVARDIARANVPVILDPLDNLPASFELQGATLRNAALLNDAGVPIAIAGLTDVEMFREPRFNAGTAVANGLPYKVALAAITITPAKIFGLAGHTGSLEVGKDADLVIWTGDPLEIGTNAEAVFVGGKAQSIESRGQRLAERYRNLPGTDAPAYR